MLEVIGEMIFKKTPIFTLVETRIGRKQSERIYSNLCCLFRIFFLAEKGEDIQPNAILD